ncbi:sugar ABC transporter ATP-binding protein [Hyphomicrobium sp. MC1]|uniref:sugar ABC transporter ATP-binding protein n=1 Tax=Hyphomicrobium sp. (strain MC1) TaxID=717785 RepID=UPI000213F843|nr:sugar ABC transporter ATP-binding protein [Hyphomicrobium sp. MC1]CCB63414.1 ABC transporter related protein [Hyphomicrobium sp. MC1]
MPNQSASDCDRVLESAPNALAPAVEIRNVSKRFGATQALRDVSLRFLPGEIHCLLGENGAGKSTVGKIVGGLYRADDGFILLDGTATRFRSIADARKSGVVLVFQELSLAPDLTVRENICLGNERGSHPFSLLRTAKESHRCRELLTGLGLSIDLDIPTKHLPIAMQQLIEIAKALALRPRVLILDEPTAMLGAVEKRKLFEILERAKTSGMTIVLVTHHIDEVIEAGDRVSVMKDGALVDSFAVDDRVDAAYVLQKLSGKQDRPLSTPTRHKRPKDELLLLHDLPNRQGCAPEIRIARGEIVGLYGVVGCGRETIVASLAGLQKFSGPKASLEGREYAPRSAAEAAAAGVGYLPSGRASNGVLSTRAMRENLTLTQLRSFSRAGVISIKAERAAAQHQLRKLGVRFGDDDAAITSLSGGNQQKVLLGRCLNHAKKLLILEDPTAGIDVSAKSDIHELLRQRVREGLSILVASSDLGETIRLCDVIFTMFDGLVVHEYVAPTSADEAAIIGDVLGDARSDVAVHHLR